MEKADLKALNISLALVSNPGTECRHYSFFATHKAEFRRLL